MSTLSSDDDLDIQKNQVVIFNLSETDDVNCKDADLCAVGYILNAIQVQTTNVTKIARMGLKNDSIKEPRPLLIEFLSETDTLVVINKSHVFNRYPLCQGIWIKSSYSLKQHNHAKSHASDRKQSPSNPSKKTPPPFINPFANFGLQKPHAAPREINILVIGQTGVGKSTWINGIANYMIFNTLDDALAVNKPACLVPMKIWFQTGDKVLKEFNMELTHGKTDQNEGKQIPGQSCTQKPKVYRFVTDSLSFGLIDTPGIGDTRGMLYDIENMKMIAECISSRQKIHGICILLKPNVSRLTASLRYCIEELLVHLHKNSIPNIAVVFTNTSNTLFKPGNTMTTIRQLFEDVKSANQNLIALDDHNVFCIENEAVKTLYANSKKAKLNNVEINRNSWQRTVNETHRLFKYFADIVPHDVIETKATSQVRNILTQLASILADFDNDLNQKRKIVNEQEKQLTILTTSLAEREKSTSYETEYITETPLTYPATVCGDFKCIDIIIAPNSDIQQTFYNSMFTMEEKHFSDYSTVDSEDASFEKIEHQQTNPFFRQNPNGDLMQQNYTGLQYPQSNARFQQPYYEANNFYGHSSVSSEPGNNYNAFSNPFASTINTSNTSATMMKQTQNSANYVPSSIVYSQTIPTAQGVSLHHQNQHFPPMRHPGNHLNQRSNSQPQYNEIPSINLSYPANFSNNQHQNTQSTFSQHDPQFCSPVMYQTAYQPTNFSTPSPQAVSGSSGCQPLQNQHFQRIFIPNVQNQNMSSASSSHSPIFHTTEQFNSPSVQSHQTMPSAANAEFSNCHNSNMNYSQMLQDPNFLEQVSGLLQQMQIVQQNRTMPGFQTYPSHPVNYGCASNDGTTRNAEYRNIFEQRQQTFMQDTAQFNLNVARASENTNADFSQIGQNVMNPNTATYFNTQNNRNANTQFCQNIPLQSMASTQKMPYQSVESEGNMRTSCQPGYQSSVSEKMQSDINNFGGINPQQPKFNPDFVYNSNMTPHNAKNNNESSSESEKEENVEEYKNILFKEQHVLYTGPKKTLNILVLGETGVGKSTFINATANYMSFDTLDDALEAPKPICLIPSKFTHWETSTKSIEVTLESSHGEKDENELFTKKSQSQTQATKTYQFETSKYIINIMDSPGIGDARGLEQDQENMINILNALGQHEDLHAICLLFKANEPKLTQTMSYCIGELLLRLHKDAINNIFFFFTNSRVTDYSIGDTSLPLQAFFSELFNTRGIKIPFEPENICCTDNESFCLICAYHCGANFTEEEFNAYATSWKQSATETHRFIEFAARKSSHQVADTLAVNKIRTIILCLAKPLATINELIESNIKVINDKKRELHNTANDLNELKKKLKITLIGMEIKPLNYPKTVCTAASCVEHQMLPGTEQYKTHYKQVCHDHCFLKNVEVEKVEDPNLKGCSAMAGQLNCRVCEHSWKEHMHIRFDQFKTTIEVEDKITKTQIKSNQDASVLKNQMIENHENSIKELKAEQKKIMESSLRFGKFLDDNAILPYNDAFEEYVGKTISEEKNCVAAGGDRSKLDNMQKFLAEYRAQKMILKKAKKEPGVSGTITPDEIAVIKTELYDLPRYGQLLKDLFEATEDGIAKHVAHTTVKYTPPIAKNQTHYGERKATKKEKTKYSGPIQSKKDKKAKR